MRNLIVSLVVALVFVAFGGVQSAQAADLSNGVSLPGLNLSTDTYQQWDGSTTFSSSIQTLNQVTRASVSFSKDTSDPSLGSLWMYFQGVVGASVTQKEYQSSSRNFNYQGHPISTNVGVGAYQETSWVYPPNGGEGTPIYGNWMSTADASATLSGVSLISVNSGYDENTYTDYGKGGYGAPGTDITQFSAWAQFSVRFDDLTSPPPAIYSGAPTTMTAVPEPATLSLIGLGGIALIQRRRQRQ